MICHSANESSSPFFQLAPHRVDPITKRCFHSFRRPTQGDKSDLSRGDMVPMHVRFQGQSRAKPKKLNKPSCHFLSQILFGRFLTRSDLNAFDKFQLSPNQEEVLTNERAQIG